MNRLTFLAATILTFGVAAASAQTTSIYVQASKIVGMKVKDSNGEVVGTIKDVVLDRETGCMAYTVISTGDSSTRLTGTTKTVPVPWAVYNPNSDPTVMTLTVDRERIYGAPAFEYSRINEYSTSSYINDVYSYYGVAPSGAARVVSNAAPGPTASIEPAASAQPNATSSPLASSTASASPSVTPEATASASASRSATATPRSNWAAAAVRASATPSASARIRKSGSSDEEASSPSGKRFSHREETSPGKSPSAEKTPRESRSSDKDSSHEKTSSTRAKERSANENSEDESNKTSKAKSSPEASPTP